MKSVNIKGMYITHKDIELLQYLHAVKVATYAQIHRDIFPSYHPKSVANRVCKLENNKFVEGSGCRSYSKVHRVISITKRGFVHFVANKSEHRQELKSDKPKHDLTLVDIRHQFQKTKQTIEYITENQLQTWGRSDLMDGYYKFIFTNCDAVAHIQFPKADFKFPIEYEGTQKTSQRYERMVRMYYNRDAIPIVLFISETQAIMRKVMKIEKQLFNWEKPKFFYCLKSEMNGSDSLIFRNCNESEINLAKNQTDG